MSDTWTVNYLPIEGGRITGKISVGDDGVRFDALYDSSNKEIIKGIFGAAPGLAAHGFSEVRCDLTDRTAAGVAAMAPVVDPVHAG